MQSADPQRAQAKHSIQLPYLALPAPRPSASTRSGIWQHQVPQVLSTCLTHFTDISFREVCAVPNLGSLRANLGLQFSSRCLKPLLHLHVPRGEEGVVMPDQHGTVRRAVARTARTGEGGGSGEA